MAFIYLPSLRTSEQVGRLQVGLARALARGFAVAPGEVLVVTSIIEWVTWSRAARPRPGSGCSPRSRIGTTNLLRPSAVHPTDASV
jgi:hypothetical protein